MEIGVDTGGTFTDFVCRKAGEGEWILKVPSTPATNAVLERKGAVTRLLTTAGFRDVLEIGRQLRTVIYDLELDPETLVFLRSKLLTTGGMHADPGLEVNPDALPASTTHRLHGAPLTRRDGEGAIPGNAPHCEADVYHWYEAITTLCHQTPGRFLERY